MITSLFFIWEPVPSLRCYLGNMYFSDNFNWKWFIIQVLKDPPKNTEIMLLCVGYSLSYRKTLENEERALRNISSAHSSWNIQIHPIELSVVLFLVFGKIIRKRLLCISKRYYKLLQKQITFSRNNWKWLSRGWTY